MKKMGYIRGSIKAPNEDDPKYDDWFSEDKKNQELAFILNEA
jgi:hypothetical protein